MKDREPIIFTPGLSSQSLTMNYYPIENTIIAGLVGSGKDTCVKAIVRSILDKNKLGKVSFVYIDTFLPTMSPLSNTKRVTPYSELMSEIDPDNYFYSIRKLLEKLAYMTSAYASKEYGNEDGTIVVIINNFGALPLYLKSLVNATVKKANFINEIKFILCGQGSSEFIDILDFVPYRILTRTSENSSNDLIHCNLASRCADKYGTCWFYSEDKPDTYTKHKVQFIPDSLLNKLLKMYTCKVISGMSQIETYYYIKENEDDLKVSDFAREFVLNDIRSITLLGQMYDEYISLELIEV